MDEKEERAARAIWLYFDECWSASNIRSAAACNVQPMARKNSNLVIVSDER